MPIATGQRALLVSLTSSIVAIICLSVEDSLQDGSAQGKLGADQSRSQSLAALASYLVPNETYSKLTDQTDSDGRLLSVLDRIGPDMKPANGFVDPPNITLDVARRAWQLMHNHAEQFAADRVDLLWPVVRQTLVQAEVSGECLVAAQEVASSARNLKTWAVKCEYQIAPSLVRNRSPWGRFP
jgi:hypothetical protein